VEAEAPGKFFKVTADKERPITAQNRPDGYSHGQQKRIAFKLDGFDKIRAEKGGAQGNQEKNSRNNPAGEGYSPLDFPDRRGGAFLLPDSEHYRLLEIRRRGEKIVPQNIPGKLKPFDFLGALGAEETVQPEPQPEIEGKTPIPHVFV
jgi:hypothetical protein